MATKYTRKSSTSGSEERRRLSLGLSSASAKAAEKKKGGGLVNVAVESSSLERESSLESNSVDMVERSAKENVSVTVRFRPLSPKEIRQGEEIAWYADGETIVRSEYNPNVAYAYDRVFGPTTTTHHVYDVAAQDVVTGAMEGINGTIFAYGVTSSGKTHTMHGDQRSPGIIPLAVKDAFSVIQETPSREFLLRVSYLEIYNEVVNDLLNPEGQNLKIREDLQGTYVEGIKEEVVLSPAHALSLIATGEAHRHVGSTNFNLLSSRSHSIFTLTIESSACGEKSAREAVNLSQLNLIDLAGSESSKAETTGVRRKEGSYINKSLLTLGTVISKLTDGKSAHVPYRDSKLTRLLQSSLSGHGRVSLICNVTPSSSNSEETHNTLKFAHRAKHVEIQASQNKIIDEKSLIKKYQNEISSLKEELEQLRKGIVVKQKLEDGHVKLQTRLEEEEEAKAALLGRIQRLTKLILVSTKATPSKFSHRPGPRRRHSFGEEELAYLPSKRRDLILDEESIDLYGSLEGVSETVDATFKEDKRIRKHGLLNWFKLRKRESLDGDKSSNTKSTTAPSTPQAESINCPTEPRISNSVLTESMPSTDLLGSGQDREELGEEMSSASVKTIDQIDLLREQQKLLSGEVALHSSALRCLTNELASDNPRKEQSHVEIGSLSNEIKLKNQQISLIDKQIVAAIRTSNEKINRSDLELSPSFAEVVGQLNEKSFELEVKGADNRIIQEQLNEKISECQALEETISVLKEQLSETLEVRNSSHTMSPSQNATKSRNSQEEVCSNRELLFLEHANEGLLLQTQADEIAELKHKVLELVQAKQQLETRNQKLAEESSYAKGLASAAAVELKALSEEVSKLMDRNEKLTADLAASKSPSKNLAPQRRPNGVVAARNNGIRKESPAVKRSNQVGTTRSSPGEDIKRKELEQEREREKEVSLSYEAALLEKEQNEEDLLKRVEESKQREAYLENELANMWVLVANLKKSGGADDDESLISETTNSPMMLNGSAVRQTRKLKHQF